jgi:TRAP-type mannitol/chloroaromatic compound transport system substrate-binding protein
MGGWFRQEIKSLDDLKGVKMRTAGFAGEVLSKIGVVPQQLAGGDVYPALEKGTLDAVEFVGPFDDEKLGFVKVAPYYYYPGFWEGGPAVSLYTNQDEFEKLPAVYKHILETASFRATHDMLAIYDYNNAGALRNLIAEGAILREFPRDILEAAYKATGELYKEYSDNSEIFKKLHDDYIGYRDSVAPWFNVLETSYTRFLAYAINRL